MQAGGNRKIRFKHTRFRIESKIAKKLLGRGRRNTTGVLNGMGSI